MTKSEKKQLVVTNVAIWAGAILASVILPMVTESITDGSAAGLKMMVQTGPLILAMLATTTLLNKGIGQPTD